MTTTKCAAAAAACTTSVAPSTNRSANDGQAKAPAQDQGVRTRKPVLANRTDAIRIVPLFDAGDESTPTIETAVAPTTTPQLIYRNGPLLTAGEVFTIFWGTAWQQAQAPLVGEINQFFDFILKSPLMTQLAEYSVPGKAIGAGSRTGTLTLTTPLLHRSVTDTAIQHVLRQEISANAAVPHPTPNTLYFVYLPPGVKVVQGGAASCQAFCGYHNDISGAIFCAVMPFPCCKLFAMT